VTLVHFAEWIDSGVKPWMVPDITNRVQNDEIPAFWRHRISEVLPKKVRLRHEETGEVTEIANDWVLAMIGWRSDSHLLGQLGVEVDPATAVPRHDPATMETNVPGVYIAGVLAAGSDANKIFIENGKAHGELIVEALR
jgi:thioredoxin reductase (NADPH)